MVKRPGCTMLVTRSARTWSPIARNSRRPSRRNVDADRGDQERDDDPTARNGRNSRHGDMPAAFITMISESLPSLLSTCATAIMSAIGAMISTQQRNDQAGDADEDQDALALVGHQVDVAQRLRDPHQRGHADENDQERTERGAENIPADGPHPTTRPRSRRNQRMSATADLRIQSADLGSPRDRMREPRPHRAPMVNRPLCSP